MLDGIEPPSLGVEKKRVTPIGTSVALIPTLVRARPRDESSLVRPVASLFVTTAPPFDSLANCA